MSDSAKIDQLASTVSMTTLGDILKDVSDQIEDLGRRKIGLQNQINAIDGAVQQLVNKRNALGDAIHALKLAAEAAKS